MRAILNKTRNGTIKSSVFLLQMEIFSFKDGLDSLQVYPTGLTLLGKWRPLGKRMH
jgi:hypothetical protein